MKTQGDLLIIGYGNTLRRDDGVGVKVAEAVAELDLPGVRVLARHQLVPELTESISRASTVVFVDADPAAGASELRPLMAAPAPGRILAHAADPAALLAMTAQVFGRVPRAWSLPVPAADFAFGDTLSPRAQTGLHAAVQEIQRLAAAECFDETIFAKSPPTYV